MKPSARLRVSANLQAGTSGSIGLVGTGLGVNDGDLANRFGRASGHVPPDLQGRHLSAEGGTLSVATVQAESAARPAAGLDRAFLCARVAEDNKAQDILVLDMRGITPIYD